MINRFSTVWILTLVLCTASALAANVQPPVFQGRVVDQTDEQGFDHITICTPGGERIRFRLGEAGTCRGLVSVGDQVRICPVDICPAGSPRLVQGMKVRRTGASYAFRNSAGEINPQWAKTRARDGSCGRTSGTGCPRDPLCPSGGGGAGGSRGGSGGGGGGGHPRGAGGNGGGGR